MGATESRAGAGPGSFEPVQESNAPLCCSARCALESGQAGVSSVPIAPEVRDPLKDIPASGTASSDTVNDPPKHIPESRTTRSEAIVDSSHGVIPHNTLKGRSAARLSSLDRVRSQVNRVSMVSRVARPGAGQTMPLAQRRKSVVAMEEDAVANLHPVVVLLPNHDSGSSKYSALDLSGERQPPVSFLEYSKFVGLEIPWPRSQELFSEKCLCMPRPRDRVVAVSHMWFYQAHPDPLSEKTVAIKGLLDKHVSQNKTLSDGRLLLFFDWMSMTQRPFKAGQKPRSPSQEVEFGDALKIMPMIYLHADMLILLDEVPAGELPGDGVVRTVKGQDLRSLDIRMVGGQLRIMGHQQDGPTVPFSNKCTFGQKLCNASEPSVRPFDEVISIDGHSLASMNTFAQTPLLDNIYHAAHIHVRRARYGKATKTRPGDRGWVFLERFIAMVKVAMIPGATHGAQTIVLSDSSSLLKEIQSGGRGLQEAAKQGEAALRTALLSHVDVLKTKIFAGSSLDKQNNTGGLGGTSSKVGTGLGNSTGGPQRTVSNGTTQAELESLASGGQERCMNDSNKGSDSTLLGLGFRPEEIKQMHQASPSASPDQKVVESIMTEMVGYLSKHWATEARYLKKTRIRKVLKYIAALGHIQKIGRKASK